MYIDYPASKAREHIATSAITSGWWQDVYVYRLHETRYNSGEYAVEMLDVFRYSHTVKTQSRKDMLEDAMDAFVNHQIFSHHKLHATGEVEGRPFFEYASTCFGYDGDVTFSPGQHIGGVEGPKHRVIVVAVIGSVLTPQMVKAAEEYAKSLDV